LNLADDADLVVGQSHNLIATNLARLPRFDDAIDTDVASRDHALGSTSRGRKSEQVEENVQLDEVVVELEGARGHGYLQEALSAGQLCTIAAQPDRTSEFKSYVG
jgi:hypothetical protein